MTRKIKRYTNRKLYDTEGSAYVSLHDILKFIRADEDIEVTDSRTGKDITSVILAQAMAEEEKSKGGSVLSQETLKELIKRGSQSLNNIRKKSRYVRKGAMQMAEESASKYYRKLLKYGEVDEREARDYLRQLSGAIKRRHHSVEQEIDERVIRVVEALHLPTRADLERISRKIDAIDRKLDSRFSTDQSKRKSVKKKK
jgi:polyhydroxyalkanoate synthesis repressor PhaR